MEKDLYISTPGELLVQDEFYDYDAKYKKNTTKLVIPADLSKETQVEIENYARKAFKILNKEEK